MLSSVPVNSVFVTRLWGISSPAPLPDHTPMSPICVLFVADWSFPATLGCFSASQGFVHVYDGSGCGWAVSNPNTTCEDCALCCLRTLVCSGSGQEQTRIARSGPPGVSRTPALRPGSGQTAPVFPTLSSLGVCGPLRPPGLTAPHPG